MSEIKVLVRDLLDRLGTKVRWDRLPRTFGLLKLYHFRKDLRELNLHDTESPPLARAAEPAPPDEADFRTFDGTCNDLDFPQMGAVGRPFGRNFPLGRVQPEADLMSPSPRLVSQKLLTRDTFRPARILNLLAAAWIQFQVHDWFVHARGKEDDAHEIPLPPGDPWPHGPMRVPRTPALSPASPGRPPTFANLNSHWWDASQVYGADEQSAALLRAGFDGKMKIGEAGLLPLSVDGVELAGFSDNWWVGLSLLHLLFVHEHNAVCDRLKLENPDWDDEKLFRKGRLVVSALLAKIHTVEWTPAILPHPTVAAAMRGNWSGLVGDELQELLPLLGDSEILGGIVGSEADHHAARYSLTEEFVSVYRMHPLMPDDFEFYSLRTGELLGRHALPEVSLGRTREIVRRYDVSDLLYSFGVAHPGAVCLHNYPRHLQALTVPGGGTIDLAAIDVLRDRERGVPRYNDFREMLRLPRVGRFEEMTADAGWAKQLREVYGDVDRVDAMVGSFAEPLLEGFGFSETAFRVFILMASRRLKSDRFFTSSFDEATYTRTGLDWVRDNSMVTVLLRHFPALEPALRGVGNAFQPWKAT